MVELRNIYSEFTFDFEASDFSVGCLVVGDCFVVGCLCVLVVGDPLVNSFPPM